MDAGGNLVWVWLLYGLISIGLTYVLARVLYRNGAVFLRTVFKDNRELADAVNVLLVVGFYMLNLGYAALLLRPGSIPSASGPSTASAYLVNKLGVLLVSLGVIHFVNMSVFYVLGRPRRVTPPIAPAPGWGPPPAAPPPRPSDAGGPPATGPVRI